MSPADNDPTASSSSSNLSSHDIIQQLVPAVIPRISSVANMAWCERAAYDISFLGVESNYLPGAGDIGSSVHRVVIKSTLEIVQSIKNGATISKADALNVFLTNAQQEVDINWKFYMLSGIEQPLPIIMTDLNIRAERLADQLTANGDNNDDYQKLLLRSEFTIRNPEIPLEGRLDLLKIRLTEPVSDPSLYITADDLVNLNIEDIEIVQIKTGKAKPRSPRIYMQADAEALLLMETLKLQKPPLYTWQFADKDVKRRSFNFAKVHQVIDKFIRLWKAQESPSITGYCPTCPLKNACLGWHFARSDKLSYEDLAKRRAAFNLSRKIREEIEGTDRWKVYVSFKNPEERHQEGWAITGLKLDKDRIDPVKQEVVLTSEEGRSFGNFIDFSVGDFVTVSDGDPNLGCNPTAIISDIDLDRSSVKLQSIRNDLYVLTYDNRHNSTFTMDRFDFDKGLTTIRYLDDFFRQSSYAGTVLGLEGGGAKANGSCNNNNSNNNINIVRNDMRE
jgi:CRISPR/Cas system-associated exonuclease Cas4 (RecB family)